VRWRADDQGVGPLNLSTHIVRIIFRKDTFFFLSAGHAGCAKFHIEFEYIYPLDFMIGR